MKRSVLVVDDVKKIRQGFAKALTRAGWTVEEAWDKKSAVRKLSAGRFDILILDRALPAMTDGFDLIETVRQHGYHLPPVFVISGYLDLDAFQRFLSLGVQCLLPKPVNPTALPVILNAFADGRRPVRAPALKEGESLQVYSVKRAGQLTYIYRRKSDTDINQLQDARRIRDEQLGLSEAVARRERALLKYFTAQARQPVPFTPPEPLLVVARRWNSWYPSFFDVYGGGYVVLGGCAADCATPGAVIDPGFRALSIMRSLGISVAYLKKCIVTHNHPDHCGGILEYVAARHVLGETTSIFCTPTVAESLRPFAGSHLDVGDFDSQDVDLIAPYEAARHTRRRVRATPFETSHHNTGFREGSRGIILSSEVAEAGGSFCPVGTAVIVGDTEYQSDRHHPNARIFEGIRSALTRPDLRVAVLHLGCSQLREGTGKHLYLSGLIDLLGDIEHERWTSDRRLRQPERKLLILLSEWGLEHASRGQIRSALSGDESKELRSFTDSCLVIKTIEVVRKACGLRTINLLPADIGLAVGIESGMLYLRENGPIKPEDLNIEAGQEGLLFSIKNATKMRRSTVGS